MSDALRSYFDDMEIALLAHGSDSIPREIVGDWMNGLRARLAAVEQERASPAPPSSDHANWMIAEADIAILRTALEGFVCADFESVPPSKFVRAVELLQAECREALARVRHD
jgi:hypothetical protein